MCVMVRGHKLLPSTVILHFHGLALRAQPLILSALVKVQCVLGAPRSGRITVKKNVFTRKPIIIGMKRTAH